MEAVIILLGIIGLVIGIIIYDSFSWGYVCFKFWYWFVLPVFPALPLLNFWQCVGLMFFISLFKNHNVSQDKDDDKATSRLIGILAAPWLLLIIAYFFK